VARLLGLPHIGSWGHDCLARLETGTSPDFSYLAAVGAAAAVSLGIPFEMDVPVRDGRVSLPGLGALQAAGQSEWIKLSSDGERLRVGEGFDLACAALVPDDGSGGAMRHWRGTPVVRCVADEQTWEVLLEIGDRHLDRYSLPMLTVMATAEVASWRQRLQGAWELLIRHHEWAAEAIGKGVLVIVPLVPRSVQDSATSPAAFGSIATSLPPSALTMAETLVHEFQHVKLCGLMDMLPLIEPNNQLGYAPWRDDPRPTGGILQGLYAFTGIVRFWDVQRCLETEPDTVLRASVLYERWRLAIGLAVGPLLDTGLLTPDGVRFVNVLREWGARRQNGPVSVDVAEIAREVALDNWLTWQVTHAALNAAEVAALAAAYWRGEPLGGRALPEVGIQEDIRKFDSIQRSRLLVMRYQEPSRYRQSVAADDLPGLCAADSFLVRGDVEAAVGAYRARLAAEPDPSAWIGLALAIHRLPPMPSRSVFAAYLPLLFEIHAFLATQGICADPLELAAWFE
jgi:HEXXH motif-containing protein